MSVPRYKIVEGSKSAHCCFEFTVVDTHKPDMVGGRQYVRDGEPQFETICECFERADADLIVTALNHPQPASPESGDAEPYIPPEDRFEASRRQALELVNHLIEQGGWRVVSSHDLHCIRDGLQARSTAPKPAPGDAARDLVEALINAAMSVLHHDGNDEGETPVDTYNYQTLRKKFTALLAQHAAPVLTEEERRYLELLDGDLAEAKPRRLAWIHDTIKLRAILKRISGAPHGRT